MRTWLVALLLGVGVALGVAGVTAATSESATTAAASGPVAVPAAFPTSVGPDGLQPLGAPLLVTARAGELSEAHAAPWSVADQGVRNVSHGCINLSPADALWFYELAKRGDVVQVVGTDVPPKLDDPGAADWNLTFEEWRG